MSLVFRQDIDLKEAVLRSAVIVLAHVDRLSNEGQNYHGKVERVLRGELTVGAELEILPAGHQLAQQAADAYEKSGLSISYAVPTMEGKAPEIKAGKSYVFLLTPGRELVAHSAWRAAKDVDAVAALVPNA